MLSLRAPEVKGVEELHVSLQFHILGINEIEQGWTKFYHDVWRQLRRYYIARIPIPFFPGSSAANLFEAPL